MSLDLEQYMNSRYVNGGREWPQLDCWGMTRLLFRDIHGVELPLLKGLDANSLIGKSKNHAVITEGMLKPCDPAHGAIAAVVTGKVCEHVGICIILGGGFMVIETTGETGPRLIPLAAFLEERANVRYYAPA